LGSIPGIDPRDDFPDSNESLTPRQDGPIVIITLLGAAGDVTGSAYLVQTSSAAVLVDFGMFQGGPELEEKNVLPDQITISELDAVVLTHAHLDHSGRLPLLTRAGYGGPIHATPATVEMASLILRDSGRIQESDAHRANRRRRQAGQVEIPPRYGSNDVEAALAGMQEAPYDVLVPVAPGIKVQFVEAGHMLGSTSIKMTVTEDGIEGDGKDKVIVFSGDIGPSGAPWLRDASPFQQADLVFLESTYGNRDHRSLRNTLDEGREIIKTAVARTGAILVPAFAVGRSQQLLYHVTALFRDDVVSRFPLFLDSPMAIAATRIYAKHPELFDEEAMELIREGQLQEDLQSVRIAETAEQSMAINEMDGPFMVIASSGMCTSGRIVHHLRNRLWQPDATVIIVGYQSRGSLGRQLVDGADRVHIFGEEIDVNAQIHTLGGFSAHAGQTELLRWYDSVASANPRVVLTHGEADGRNALAWKLAQRYGVQAQLPTLGDIVSL
jgi:metallo-beta-lactamase family protein